MNPLDPPPLAQARINLIRTEEVSCSMLRYDYLRRARDNLREAGFPMWAQIAEDAMGRIGGDGRSVREILAEIERMFEVMA